MAAWWRGRTVDAATARRLLIAAAGVAIALVVALTPLGAEIRRWLLY